MMKGKRTVSFSLWVAGLLVAFSWFFVIVVDKADFMVLFSADNILQGKKFILGLLGIGVSKPAFFNGDYVMKVFMLAVETVKISVLAIGFATIAMLATVIPGARNVADGTLSFKRGRSGWILFGGIRSLYMFTRAIPELIWALMIIFVLKPGIFAGAVALGIHNFGVLGKLCTEVVEDLDVGPVRNLATCGAGRLQILAYGVVPMVFPKFLTYIVYRFEVIIRTTIVVGFIGAGGLGQEFKLAMSYFRYSDVGLILLAYVVLVWLADLLSGFARRMSA